MVPRVTVDDTLCVSSGGCVADAPAAFVFDEDEIAHATAEAPSMAGGELVRIARNCPLGAIEVSDGVDIAGSA